MRCYFDQRNFEQVNVYIYIDDTYHGKLVAKERTITGIELPQSAKKVRLSFSSVFDSSKELDSAVVNQEKETHIPETKGTRSYIINKAWEYAYDVEFDASKYSEDVVFIPENFKVKALKEGVFYRGMVLRNEMTIEQKLIKRVKSFGIEEHRKKTLLKCVVSFPICCVLLYNNLRHYILDNILNQHCGDYGFHQEFLVSIILFSVLGIIGSAIVFKNKWSYCGLYREKEMDQEYWLKEGDCI